MPNEALHLTAAAIRFFRVHPPQISRLASARLEDLLGSKSEAQAVPGVPGWGWEDRPRWSFVNGCQTTTKDKIGPCVIASGRC